MQTFLMHFSTLMHYSTISCLLHKFDRKVHGYGVNATHDY